MNDSSINVEPKTPTTVIVIAVISILLLIIATLVFFLIANTPPNHQITVQNNTSTELTVLGIDEAFTLNPHSNRTFSIPSGRNLNIQAIPIGANSTDADYSTSVVLNLGSFNAEGVPIVDKYAVSVRSGFNLAATIVPTAYYSQDKSNIYSCQSPNWKFIPGITGTTINDCPIDLQYSTDNFQSCISPCEKYGSTPQDYCCNMANSCRRNNCQARWGDQIDYWNLLDAACPNCLITNCDQLNYFCQNNNSANGISYLITFMDQ